MGETRPADHPPCPTSDTHRTGFGAVMGARTAKMNAVKAVYTDIIKSAVRAGSLKRYMNARQEFLAFHISGQVGNLST